MRLEPRFQIPDDPQEAIKVLAERLRALEDQVQKTVVAQTKVVASEPAKPRDGLFAYADGTNWNPGAGRGLYQYVNGTWQPVSAPRPPEPVIPDPIPQTPWAQNIDAAGKNLSGLGVVSFGAAGYIKDARAESGATGNVLDMPLMIRKPIPDQSGNYGAMLGFGTEHVVVLAKAGIAFIRTGGYGTGTLHFLVDSVEDLNPVALADSKMQIDRLGNIGIGASPPKAKLDVGGMIRATPTDTFLDAGNGKGMEMLYHLSGDSSMIQSYDRTAGGYKRLQLKCSDIFVVPSAGVFVISGLPTSSAGLTSGALWRDAAAGNVLKMVP